MLRTYQVAPEIAKEVANVLSRAMMGTPNSPPLGQAVVGAGGQLIVTGTPEVQKGVAQVIAGVGSRDLPPTPTIAFDLWILTGTPGTGPAGTALPQELSPAVQSLRQTGGPIEPPTS